MMIIVKTTLISLLAFWMGISNIAYSSARAECAGMMQKHAASPNMDDQGSCCPSSVPCQCSIEERSDDRTVPVHTTLYLTGQDLVLATFSETVLPDKAVFQKILQVPFPESPPLYQLNSVYRL